MNLGIHTLISLIYYSFIIYIAAVIIREAIILLNLSKYWKQGIKIKYTPIFGSLALLKSSPKDEDGLQGYKDFYKSHQSADMIALPFGGSTSTLISILSPKLIKEF